jgi:aspartate kinase
MALIVQKFGGTSLADVAKIQRCAARAVAARRDGHDVVVVVSAMGQTTDELLDLAGRVCAHPPKREMDQLLASGEIVSIALMAMAIYEQGYDAISFTGPQIDLLTDDAFTKARIQRIDTGRIRAELANTKVVVVAGFQGHTAIGDMTTLGRGGSNATLVALGAVLRADMCENYTDVDGVFTADPRIVPNARKIDQISYDEMLELSGLGAAVLQTRAVEFAKKYDVPIHVRNSAHDRPGTIVSKETPEMEQILVSGAALKRNLVRVTISNIPNRPGIEAVIFRDIAAANIIVDDIIQNVLDIEGGSVANISFTVEDGDLHDIRPVVDRLIKHIGGSANVRYQSDLAKVSVVGVGMRSHTGVAHRMFEALSEAQINIQNITTSEIKISCIGSRQDGNKALQVVHDAFELEKEPTTGASFAARG